MQHDAKPCLVCGAAFTPDSKHSPSAAVRVKTCGDECRSELRSRQATSQRARFRQQHSGASSDMTLCQCSACKAGRDTDRTALIARVAAEKGVPVADGRKPLKKPTWLARHQAIRDGKRERDLIPAPRWQT